MPATRTTVRPPVSRPIAVSVSGRQGELPVKVTCDTPFGLAVTGAVDVNPGYFEYVMSEKGLTPPPQVLTFEAAQKTLTALQAGKGGTKADKAKKILKPGSAFLEHVFLAAVPMVGTYAAVAGAGALLTWGAMALLGQPFTQWPAIDAVAKILAVLASGLVPALFIKPTGVFLKDYDLITPPRIAFDKSATSSKAGGLRRA